MPKYNALVHNTVAKEIRETFQDALDGQPTSGNFIVEVVPRLEQQMKFTAIETLTQIALKFATRFQSDNAFFKPQEWLDQCSPDTQKYPLGELWQKNSE